VLKEDFTMKLPMIGIAVLVCVVTASGAAFAQGGGASSTGTIQGRVIDSQGAVLPGVAVTATSPALIQPQTTVTSDTGNYRFPAVPPGTYELSYELGGFNGLKRSGISITLGFTANVNVELALATVQETVTVSGASPVIDTSTTRVQQNFKMEQLQSIPNGRDMWALLAVTPSVQMGRIDVGGNRAGTQTGYTAYGFNGQVRVLIEGINTTEGTGGAGFYFDYASLEEAFLGTSGQSAEMPNPGVQSQFIARSGSNQFQGEYHLDWYNNALQGSNIPDEYTVPTAFNNSPIRAHSNEIDRYYDHDINLGGPLKKDKLWMFGTYDRHRHGLPRADEFQPRGQRLGLRRSCREDSDLHEPSPPSCVRRRVQPDEQLRVGNYQPGHGPRLSETIRDSGAADRTGRLPVHLLALSVAAPPRGAAHSRLLWGSPSRERVVQRPPPAFFGPVR
jgi:hypothetical protein